MIFIVAFCLFLEELSAAKYGQVVPNIHSSLSRTKRHPTGYYHCEAVINRAYCSTSFAQNFINSLSKCGEEVSNTELNCRKSERGLFCLEALTYVYRNCSGTCTAECSNSLWLAGCCANNGTSSLSTYLAICNISLPSPCKRSSLQIPNIVQDRSCTSRDYTSAFCDNIGPLITALARDEACKEDTEAQRDLCSSKNGQYCEEDSSIGFQAIRKSTNNCPSVSNCSLQCHTSLNLVKNTVGCCFPYYNTTASPSQSSVHSTQLWNTCGIPVPQRCGSFSAVYDGSFVSLFLILAGFAVVVSQRV